MALKGDVHPFPVNAHSNKPSVIAPIHNLPPLLLCNSGDRSSPL